MKEKLKKIILFVKKEIVLCIALILGFCGLLFCRPGVEVIKEAIDLRVLVLLFCLMYVIQGQTVLYSSFLTSLNILYGMYRKGRSIHVPVEMIERVWLKASKLSLSW